jgi:hypothetical protein
LDVVVNDLSRREIGGEDDTRERPRKF